MDGECKAEMEAMIKRAVADVFDQMGNRTAVVTLKHQLRITDHEKRLKTLEGKGRLWALRKLLRG